MNKITLTEENSIIAILDNKNGLEDIKKELQKTVDFSKNLTITDFSDKKQIELVRDTKNGYVKTRNTIKRAFKSKRDEYNLLASDNLKAERDVISVIEWEEKRLDEMVEIAEKLHLRKQNEVKLEARVKALKECETEIETETLLEMTEKVFESILVEKQMAYVAKKQQEIKAEQEKIAREKEIEEAKKQAKLEAEQEAQRQADREKERVEREKQEAEEKAKKAKEEMERKQKEELERVEREKQEEIKRIKQEQEQKELSEKKRKEDEEKTRIEAEKKEKEEKELAEKRKEFIKYRDSIVFDHYEDKDWVRIFYKKVWEFKIK